jgi:cardiolipin synthase
MTGPILTVPNVVSAIRIALVPLFLWLMFGAEDYAVAGWLLGGIAATDWVDGFLARRLGQVSELGKILDPVADRFAVASGVLAGWITGTVPWWFALALIVRETTVTLAAGYLAARTGEKIAVRPLGKAGTFGVYVAIPNFIIEAGTGYAFHYWVSWIFGIPGMILYFAVLIPYFGDVRAALARVSSASVHEEGAG